MWGITTYECLKNLVIHDQEKQISLNERSNIRKESKEKPKRIK